MNCRPTLLFGLAACLTSVVPAAPAPVPAPRSDAPVVQYEIIVFGIVLHFRVLHRWSGQRMAWLTFVAFGFAVMTLFVVAILVPTIHNSYMVGG